MFKKLRAGFEVISREWNGMTKKKKSSKKALLEDKNKPIVLKRKKAPPPIKGEVVLCSECDSPIPPARLKAVEGTDTCVACMEQLELQDELQKTRRARPTLKGTQRHQMEFEVKGVEEVEAINLHIRRGG